MDMNKNQQRQGDLLIMKGAKLPWGAKPVEGLVLAEGEATGHAHRLTGGRLYRGQRGELYFRTGVPVELRHEEHGTLFFEPGTYEVLRQREHAADRSRLAGD